MKQPVYKPTIRQRIGIFIYKWADKKYGVKARGEVKGIITKYHPVLGKVYYSNFTPRQKKMLKKHSFWLYVKNKIIWG